MPVKHPQLWCYLKPSVGTLLPWIHKVQSHISFKSSHPSWVYENLRGGTANSPGKDVQWLSRSATQGSYILYVLVEKVVLKLCWREMPSCEHLQHLLKRYGGVIVFANCCFQGQDFKNLDFKVNMGEKCWRCSEKFTSTVSEVNLQTWSADVDNVTQWEALESLFHSVELIFLFLFSLSHFTVMQSGLYNFGK